MAENGYVPPPKVAIVNILDTAEVLAAGQMDHHLATEAEEQAGNHRNGYRSKTVLTGMGKLTLAIPRDRHERFDPAPIGKYRRRFAGSDDPIIALYARVLRTREIAPRVGEFDGVESHYFLLTHEIPNRFFGREARS